MIKSKALSLTLSAALIASMAGLAGCGNTNDGNTTKTNNISTKNNGRIGVRNQNDNGAGHDLTNLKYSRTLSAKVSKVKGVRDAHVFVTKNNAYVSLSLEGQQDGTNGRMNSMSRRGTGTNGRTDGLYGTSGTGAAGLLRGMTGTRGTTGNNTGLGANGNYGTYGTYGTGGYGTNGYRTGGYGVRGFDSGMNNSGMLTPSRSGYSTMNTGNTDNTGLMNSVPEHIRKQISSKVQKTVPSCQQVYVSADNDFYNHSSRYSTDNSLTGAGRDITNAVGNTVGMAASDLGSFINRLFPLNTNGRGMMNRNGVTPYNRDGGMMNKDGMFNRTTR